MPPNLSRRKFLKSVASTALVPFVVPSGSKRKRIAIIGAGLAGLSAAYELLQAGYDVTVLEARKRPGGRVLTLRRPFHGHGLYAEAGAMYTNDRAFHLLRYADLFEVPLHPVDFSETRPLLFHIQGKRILFKPGSYLDWPPGLSGEEMLLGPAGMWHKYVTTFCNAIGPSDRWSQELTINLEKMTFAEFLKGRGASDAAVAVLRLGYPDSFGEGIEHVSALQFLRIFSLDAYTTQVFVIIGGSDRLPLAFTTKLINHIHYDSILQTLRQNKQEVSVDFLRHGKKETLIADRVICTLPVPVLRSILFEPVLSVDKQKAIRNFVYTSVTRVYLELKSKNWDLVDANTDLPIMRVIGHPIAGSQNGVILEAFMAGKQARLTANLQEPERISSLLSEMEKVHPGATREFVNGTSYVWDQDEFAGGAFSSYGPGQLTQSLKTFMEPEGRIHFAGEHISMRPATMEGALESGNRAASEVIAAEPA